MQVRIELRRDAGRIGPSTGPWVRRKQIARVQGLPTADALAEIVGRKGETLGWGLYSPESAIAVRLLSFGAEPLAPDWLERRLAAAVAARDVLGFGLEDTTGYRLVNSEGDGLPGLVVDRYEDDLVVQITTAPMAARRAAIEAFFLARGETDGGFRIHVVLPPGAAKQEGFAPGVFRSHEVQTLRFREHGLAFETPAPPSQKTGAYFDQRENRRWVARLAAAHGGALLDVGCHIGGFALHAASAGLSAVGVDASTVALQHAARNAKSSGLGPIPWVEADMFGPLDPPALAGPFGTIVLDPPKVATNKNNVDKAIDAMRRLVGRVTPRLAPGGHLVLCSCSHHLGWDHLDRVMVRGRWARVATLGAGLDHPVMPGHREGEYLRVAVYQPR